MKSSGTNGGYCRVSGRFERQPLDHHSKRIEKREELLLLCLSQIEEAFRHVLGLALVALDCIPTSAMRGHA